MTATQNPAQDSSKQVSQQDVSDAAIADTLDQISQSINTSALDDVIAALRARELQQCPNCLNDGCHCATCNPYPGELQQVVGEAWQKGYRAGVDDERTSEANIGIAGYGAKIEPARANPHATPQSSAPVVGVTDEMVERACRRYAFREDGAVWPDAYSENEVAAERVLMRELLESALTGRG